MYKHFLLPAEFSDSQNYDRAYAVAANLLDDGGKITLLNVIEPIPTYAETYVPPNFEISSRAGLQEKLDEMAARLGISNTALVLGGAGRSIVDWAEENDADCIVITSHRPAFSDFFLGSTAAWVVRHAKMSVHVLR